MVLEIISRNKSFLKEEVESVTLPGAKGSFTVLENHASLILRSMPVPLSM